MRARAAFGACALVLVLLVPSASAGWQVLYRFSAREGRGILGYETLANDSLALATSHESSYLLLEFVNASGNRTSNLVRSITDVERATIVALGGKVGVLFSVHAEGTPAKDEGLWFATRRDAASVDVKRLAATHLKWDAAQQNATTGVTYFLQGRTMTPMDKTGKIGKTILLPATSATVSTAFTDAGELYAVAWNTSGAFLLHANASATKTIRLSTFWDYQNGRITIAGREIGVLLANRRESCDFWRGASARAEAWTSRPLDRCPLAFAPKDFSTFQLTPSGFLALTNLGFWDGRPDRYSTFLCSGNVGGWTLRADGTEWLLGDGPSVWRKVPDPAVALKSDPSRSAPTGLAVRFTTDLLGYAEAKYSWNFGDGESSTLANPLHVYFKPGNYTVAVDVRTDACTDAKGGVHASLPFKATGADLGPRTIPTGDAKANGTGDSEGGFNATLTAKKGLPSLGAPALVAVLAACALALARRRKR